MGLPKYGLPSLFLYLLNDYVSLEFFSYIFLPIDSFSLTKATKQSWCSLPVAKRNQIKGLPFLLSSRMSCFTFQRKSKLYFSNTLSPFPENLTWAIPIIRQSPHLSANNWKMENRSYVFTNTWFKLYMGRTFRDNCFKTLKEEAYYHTQTLNIFSVSWTWKQSQPSLPHNHI